MNWTGGRRARHNSNSSLNTAARLQKQYFARVRMARESAQSISGGNLVRSSSPIALAEIIRPLKPSRAGGRGRSAEAQEGGIGTGLEGGGKGNSRTLWGNKTSGLGQGEEGRGRKESGDTVRKKIGHKSRILSLDLGEKPIEVPKKPEVLRQKKSVLLGKRDWLGTKKQESSEEDEILIDVDPRFRGGDIQLLDSQEEEFNYESQNEDDAFLLEGAEADELPSLPDNEKPLWQNAPLRIQQRANYPPASQDGNDSIFLEVGNVQFSTSRKRSQNLPQVQGEFTQHEEGDIDYDVPTSDSMLLNFEDAVLPMVLGSIQGEPVRGGSSPVHEDTQAEDPSNSESFFTWSSSNYARKSGRGSSPGLPTVEDFVDVDNTMPQSPLTFSLVSPPHFYHTPDAGRITPREISSPVLPTRKSVSTAEGNSGTIAIQALHGSSHSDDQIRNSSLNAFASSVTEGEDNSDGQWFDMLLNEYYWSGNKGDLYTGHNAEILEQDDVHEEGSFTRLLDDMETRFSPVEDITASEIEENSWRDIGFQHCAIAEAPQEENRLQDHSENCILQPVPQAENTVVNEITVLEGHQRPQTKPKSNIVIDLDDDKAWRDFVHQPPVKEDWGEAKEECSFNGKRKIRSGSPYPGESDDYILPLRKRHQVMVEIPSTSEPGNEGISESDDFAVEIDVRSNAATGGTLLASTYTFSSVRVSESPRDSELGNISSLDGNSHNGDGCSSVVANVSSSSISSRLSVSGPLETEATQSNRSSSPSKIAFASALKGRNKPLRSEMKKVMWGEDLKEKEGSDIITAKRQPKRRVQTEFAAVTKAITGHQKIFEGARHKGVREARDEIEDW